MQKRAVDHALWALSLAVLADAFKGSRAAYGRCKGHVRAVYEHIY